MSVRGGIRWWATAMTSASLASCCFGGSGDDLFCDQSTFTPRCDGSTLLVCASDRMTPAHVAEQPCAPASCVEHEGSFGCAFEPLTPCESDAFCTPEGIAVQCAELGGALYESIRTQCAAGEHCEAGFCLGP